MGKRAIDALSLSGLLAAVAIAQPAAPTESPKPAPAREQTYATSWDEYQALKARAKGGTVLTPLTAPDWSGIWRRSGTPEEELNPSEVVTALTPKYKAAYEVKRAKSAKGIEWDRASACLPVGMPRWPADPWLHEFVIKPKQTWMLYGQLQEERRVYTDGRGHVSDTVAIPQWDGDSIGFWDGDTLVIHTNHMKPGEYWRGSPETSYQASTVERWRRLDADTMESRETVYDPVSLTRPVHLRYTYSRVKDPDVRIDYDSCEEGNNNFRTADGGTGTLLPGEPGYRDPTHFGIPEVALDSLPK
jgi:hypothetical protein